MQNCYKILINLFARPALLFVLFTTGCAAHAQIQSVTVAQNMSFGAFSRGNNGGTITISNSGTRSVTGDVALLNLGISYYESIFEVEAALGTVVSITNGPNVTLTGSNGGTMTMQIGSSNPASPFINSVAPPGRTAVRIGGTLTVGNATASPAGSYSGTFNITFHNE